MKNMKEPWRQTLLSLFSLFCFFTEHQISWSKFNYSINVHGEQMSEVFLQVSFLFEKTSFLFLHSQRRLEGRFHPTLCIFINKSNQICVDKDWTNRKVFWRAVYNRLERTFQRFTRNLKLLQICLPTKHTVVLPLDSIEESSKKLIPQERERRSEYPERWRIFRPGNRCVKFSWMLPTIIARVR